MSNSTLATYTKISANKTSPRNASIDTISIHCVAGQWTAQKTVDYLSSSSVGASCNYAVGTDGSIAIGVEEKDRSWCTSSSSNDNRAITIEVASDTTSPYTVNDTAMASLINLLVDVCERNGIDSLKWQGDSTLIGQVDKQNMTVHRWFSNKACPGDYLYNLHGEISDKVNARLTKEITTVAEATDVLMSTVGLGQCTINFLACYLYGDSLILKLGNAVKSKNMYSYTAATAMKSVQSATGLADNTMTFLYNYRYGDDLLIKLAQYM